MDKTIATLILDAADIVRASTSPTKERYAAGMDYTAALYLTGKGAAEIRKIIDAGGRTEIQEWRVMSRRAYLRGMDAALYHIDPNA